MNKYKHALFFACLGAIFVCSMAGCKSDVQAETTPGTNAKPVKGTFTDVIQSNPNIPDKAKRAMTGQQPGPSAGK